MIEIIIGVILIIIRGFMNIDLKYVIPFTGEYNASVFICPECDNNMIGETYANFVGFCDSPIGWVNIVECDKCFHKFYYHTSRWEYKAFLQTIELGKQKHYHE